MNDATLIDARLMNELMTAVYLGSPERAQELSTHWNSIQVQKLSQLPLPSIYIPFFCGIAAAAMYRKEYKDSQLKTLLDSSSLLAKAASFSQYNYANKAFLLHAELESVRGDGDEAERLYNLSIESARSSRFIAEEVSPDS